MDDEIKVVVEVPPAGGVSTSETVVPTTQVADAVEGAIQIAAVADAISQPDPAIAEILRLQGDLIGEVRSLREKVDQLQSATVVTAAVVADAVDELQEEIEEVAEPGATLDIPLEEIPAAAVEIPVSDIKPEERKQKKSRKWI